MNNGLKHIKQYRNIKKINNQHIMTGFSWVKAMERADEHLLRQAKYQAKKGTQQSKLDHPDEVRDANQGNYTKLTIRIKDEIAKKRKAVLARRELLGNQQT